MAEEAKKEIREYYQPFLPTTQPGIVHALINATNFELKLRLIQMARENAIRGCL